MPVGVGDVRGAGFQGDAGAPPPRALPRGGQRIAQHGLLGKAGEVRHFAGVWCHHHRLVERGLSHGGHGIGIQHHRAVAKQRQHRAHECHAARFVQHSGPQHDSAHAISQRAQPVAIARGKATGARFCKPHHTGFRNGQGKSLGYAFGRRHRQLPGACAQGGNGGQQGGPGHFVAACHDQYMATHLLVRIVTGLRQRPALEKALGQ